MSVQAITWAAAQEVFPSSHKFVLIALANFASDTGLAFPSVETICRFTCQNHKTVRNALSSLVKKGTLIDTGERTGNSQMIKVYKLSTFETLPKTGRLDTPKRLRRDSVETPERLRRDYQKRVADPIYSNNEPIKGKVELPLPIFISYDREYEEVKKEMKIIDGNYSGTQNWCADDIIKRSKLQKRYKELKELLGKQV